MKKLNRVIKNYAKHHNVDEINDKILNEIATKYYNFYQEDTIIRDLEDVTRFDEDYYEYNDVDEIIHIEPMTSDALFIYIKDIIKDKLERRDF